MLQVLRNRRFLPFWSGQTISRLGDAGFTLSLGWLVMDLTGSAMALGIVMLLMSVPEMALALLGGFVVDRYDLRKLLLVTETSAAVLTGTLWALQLSGHLALWHILMFAVLFGAVQALFSPIYLSALPRLIPEAELQPANSLLSTSEELCLLLGPAVAGFLVAWKGTALVIGVNALSFVISAGCVLLMPGVPPSNQGGEVTVWRSIGDALAYVRRQPVVNGLLVLRALGNVGYAPFELLLIVWVREVLGRGPETLGLLETALGTGTLFGSFFGFAGLRWGAGRLILAANVISGILIASLAAVPRVPISFIVILMIGYLISAEQVLVNVLYQRIVDPEYQGRVASVRVLVSRGMRSAAQGLSGWATLLIGAAPTIAVGGLLVALTGCLLRTNAPLRSAK